MPLLCDSDDQNDKDDSSKILALITFNDSINYKIARITFKKISNNLLDTLLLSELNNFVSET